MTPLWIALAGGLGAIARYALDAWVTRSTKTSLPLGTLVVNLTGCFLLGLLTGWLGGAAGQFGAILGTGFLGGYTTFSTASVEAARMLQDGRRPAALAHAAVMLAGSLAAAALGFWLTGD